MIAFNQRSGLPADVGRIVADAGGAILAAVPQIGGVVATSSDPEFAARISRNPRVLGVSEDVPVRVIPRVADMMRVGPDATGTQGPAEPAGPDPQPGPEPLFSQQWDKMRMNVSAASYLKQPGRKEVRVAILDTGVEITHPDIIPNLDFLLSRSFTNPATWPNGDPNPASWDDKHGHGSWCASAVGAPINGFGISGVAPGVTLVALKVVNDDGTANPFSIVAGILYAAENRFDVASMSLGVYFPHSKGGQVAYITLLQRAVEYARTNGVTPVAALGNDNIDLGGNLVLQIPEVGSFPASIVLPAELPGVIGVSATGYYNRKAYYSNYGVGQTDISAPGGDQGFQRPNPAQYRGLGGAIGAWAPESRNGLPPVLSHEFCSPDFGCHYYGYIQGTSMAAPNAAGVAALIISQYGDFTPDNSRKPHMSPTAVETILQRTANNQACISNTEPFYVITIPNPEPPPPTLVFDFRAECQGTAGGYTSFFGKGIVDALKAVTLGSGSSTVEPEPTKAGQ